MAITVSAKTRVTVASGALAGMGSYTVATDDLVVFPIMTDANFGDPTHVVSQTAGTATIGTPARLIHQQSGGQFDIHAARITAGGTVTFSASNPSGVRMSCAPLVLTGTVTGTPSAAVNVSGQGGSTTNNINVGATTTVADCAAVEGGTEWNDLGTPTSSDLTNFDGFNTAGASMSGGSGWKTVASAGAFTGNLNAAGAGAADWDWGAVAFAPASGGGPQTWDGSAATVTIAASSGTFTPGDVTWTGSAGTVSIAAASGSFIAGTVTWSASAAAITVNATSGSFTAGAVTWSGSAATIAVAGISGEFSSGGSPQTWNGTTGAVTVTATSGTFTPDTTVWAGSSSAVTINGISGVFLAGPATWTGTPATISIVGTSGIWFIGSAGPVITGPLLTGHDNDPRLTDPVPVDRTTTAALGERTTEAAP